MKKKIMLQGNYFRLESFDEKFITEEYVKWLRDKEISKVIISAKPDITIDEIREYCVNLIKSENDYFFAIITNEDEKHIGNVRLGPIDYKTRDCKFGILIGNKEYYNRGIGTEAVKLSLEFCFKTLGLRKVFLDVLEHNKSAIKIYEKNGFISEKIQRDHVIKNGKHYDVRFMSIINPEEKMR